MAEKSGKKKTKKAAKAETGVLGNLSATRPSRLGGDRRASSRPAAAATAKTATAAKPAAAKPKASRAAVAEPAAKPAAAKASRPAATKPSKTSRPKAVKPKVRTPEGTAPKPPSAPPAGWQTPDQDGQKGGRPGATEIVSTTVQAAGEIAQLGLTVGGQILKRAAGRIPRP
jgi:hypothetical protein